MRGSIHGIQQTFHRFCQRDIATNTFLSADIVAGVSLGDLLECLVFSEHQAQSIAIASVGDALYWGIAAFSTAGIAGTPTSGLSKLICGAWIIVGLVLFFGIIAATVTAYFMRPLQRSANQIVDLIEYDFE
jgi:voltage-gated potassium channel